MLWLGAERGYLTDWTTQLWVRLTGRRALPDQIPWLDGPTGRVTGIGPRYFQDLAEDSGLVLRRPAGQAGLVECFESLRGPELDPDRIDPLVRDFYENTSDYDLDAWADWSPAFRPFGTLLAWIFSRRLDQLNVPLSGLDTSRGIRSQILELVDPESNEVRHRAWVRQYSHSSKILYAATYSLCSVPGYAGPCIKVAFPLPNGRAVVIMKPVGHLDGSFSVVSSGDGFGGPGFYFIVQSRSHLSVRKVQTMRETIHVYRGEHANVRADHTFRLWGRTFLQIHYRLDRKGTGG